MYDVIQFTGLYEQGAKPSHASAYDKIWKCHAFKGTHTN